jgi:hypothetical protein
VSTFKLPTAKEVELRSEISMKELGLQIKRFLGRNFVSAFELPSEIFRQRISAAKQSKRFFA